VGVVVAVEVMIQLALLPVLLLPLLLLHCLVALASCIDIMADAIVIIIIIIVAIATAIIVMVIGGIEARIYNFLDNYCYLFLKRLVHMDMR
jgi:hypothetical protein